MNLQNILAVAAGGALGSIVRYLVAILSGRAFGTDFPYGTLAINITGSFLLGAFAGLMAVRWNTTEPMRLFLMVGICGGYTTFSTFSLDTWYLIERGETVAAGVYMLASVILSVAALVAALHLARALPG